MHFWYFDHTQKKDDANHQIQLLQKYQNDRSNCKVPRRKMMMCKHAKPYKSLAKKMPWLLLSIHTLLSLKPIRPASHWLLQQQSNYHILLAQSKPIRFPPWLSITTVFQIIFHLSRPFLKCFFLFWSSWSFKELLSFSET